MRSDSSEGLIPSTDTGTPKREATLLMVGAEDAGTRLDRFLAKALAGESSRARLQGLIAEGHVTLSGRPCDNASRRLQPGDVVAVEVPEAAEPEPQPEDIPLAILYEDEDLVVLDKSAGLVVHPGPGNWTGTLVNALLHHCAGSLSGIGGVKRPGIVHRLDRDTTGVMVAAKTDAAHRGLAEQFLAHGRDGRLERSYLALVWGRPSRPAGTIDAALGRSNADRTKRAIVPAGRSDAKAAITHFELARKARSNGDLASLLRCRLETGRTHQIRVHLAHIGHPLVGDGVYGAGFRSRARRLDDEAGVLADVFQRQALHAETLGFVHPRTGEVMRFTAPMPSDMRELVDALLH